MPKKSKRVYKSQPVVSENMPDWVHQIGNVLKLSGLVFAGMDTAYHLVLPDSGSFNEHVTYNPTNEEWAEILRRSDDPIFLEGGKKPWLRKAERYISGHVQQQIWVRDLYRCAFCGTQMGKALLTVDHFVPLELGGANDTTNYITACKSCNKYKGDMNPEIWCQQQGLLYDTYQRYVKSNGNMGNKPPFWDIPF